MQNAFICVFCKTKYPTRRLQDKCLKWCKEHPNECNAELLEFAIEDQEDDGKK